MSHSNENIVKVSNEMLYQRVYIIDNVETVEDVTMEGVPGRPRTCA